MSVARKCPSGGQPPAVRRDGMAQCPSCRRWFAEGELRRNPMGGSRVPSHAREWRLEGAQ